MILGPPRGPRNGPKTRFSQRRGALGAPFFPVLASRAAERPFGHQHAPKIDPNRLKIHPTSIQNLLKCYHQTLENNRCTLPKFMHKIQATTLGNPTRRAFLLRVRRSRVASSIRPPSGPGRVKASSPCKLHAIRPKKALSRPPQGRRPRQEVRKNRLKNPLKFYSSF